MKKSAIIFIVLTGLMLVLCATAEEPVITSFSGSSRLSWTHPPNGVSEYRIEWSSDLSSGIWWDLHFESPSIHPAESNRTVQVPMFYRVLALGPAPDGMAYIPVGTFNMGDSFDEGYSCELPVHTVYISTFYMDKHEVTKTKWDEVATWAAANGYDITAAGGSGKAVNHPVQEVTWFECVKWCNARSEKEGLTPCYTVSGSTYKTGESAPDCNWLANGYRLPTEAEWEKAARGRVSGQRFPWGANINHDYANYYANGSVCNYDTSLYTSATYHHDWDDGGMPYTSPVGTFAANGYGLYDMAGNVWEWCYDRYDSWYYGKSSERDPVNEKSALNRVLRGGCWGTIARNVRLTYRYGHTPSHKNNHLGFRTCRVSSL